MALTVTFEKALSSNLIVSLRQSISSSSSGVRVPTMNVDAYYARAASANRALDAIRTTPKTPSVALPKPTIITPASPGSSASPGSVLAGAMPTAASFNFSYYDQNRQAYIDSYAGSKVVAVINGISFRIHPTEGNLIPMNPIPPERPLTESKRQRYQELLIIYEEMLDIYAMAYGISNIAPTDPRYYYMTVEAVYDLKFSPFNQVTYTGQKVTPEQWQIDLYNDKKNRDFAIRYGRNSLDNRQAVASGLDPLNLAMSNEQNAINAQAQQAARANGTSIQPSQNPFPAAANATQNVTISTGGTSTVVYNQRPNMTMGSNTYVVPTSLSANAFNTVSLRGSIIGTSQQIYNNTDFMMTLTQNTGVTMYFPNTTNSRGAALTGNRQIAPRGFASLTAVAPNTYIVTGVGVF